MFQAVNVVMRTKGTADRKRQPAAYVSTCRGPGGDVGAIRHGGQDLAMVQYHPKWCRSVAIALRVMVTITQEHEVT